MPRFKDIHESEASSRCIFIEQKDAATNDDKKEKIQQQIEDIDIKIKQVTASIKIAARLLMVYEEENSKMKCLFLLHILFLL